MNPAQIIQPPEPTEADLAILNVLWERRAARRMTHCIAPRLRVIGTSQNRITVRTKIIVDDHPIVG